MRGKCLPSFVSVFWGVFFGWFAAALSFVVGVFFLIGSFCMCVLSFDSVLWARFS